MRNATRLSLALLGALSTAMLAPSAEAATGPEVLAAVDRTIGNFVDQTIIFDVANLKPGTTTPQGMKFKAIVKGGQGITEFLAPGDVKGTRVLTQSATQMWIWLPEFGKIRKVATHTLSQGFLGTTLTQQDMGTTGYGGDYNATLKSEDAATYTLDLLAKDPAAVGFPHLRMVVDKKMSVPLRVEYLAEDGTATRVQERSNYTCPKPDYCMFGLLKMTDVTRGAWTTLTPVETMIDTGVSDEIFTPKTLQLGL